MLELFRRYQKFIFLGVTIVIVISFTFFGTYNGMVTHEEKDGVAFIAVDGSKVYRSELNDMVNFISVGSQATLQWGAPFDNPFNDDVVQNNFLYTGVAEILAAPYLKTMSPYLNSCLEKEKRYTPYVNPKVPFVSAENIWGHVVPDIRKNLEILKNSEDAATPEAFSARVKLIVAERRFPAAHLKQVLKRQESQSSWIMPDQELPYRDLSLFGYHSVQDWFGKDFLELVAEYVINAAKIAESKGYSVSKDKTTRSLTANLYTNFKELQSQPNCPYQDINDYYNESLRRLGMDQVRLANVWNQVLLFRKIFDVSADSVLVSSLPYKDFYQHLDEYVEVDLYKLPQELCFRSLEDVERYELYVSAVRDPKELKAKSANPLLPPLKFLSTDEVKKSCPELVQRIYRLRFATVNKESLQTKIGVKKTWEWEAEDNNWKKLQDKFPEVAILKAKTFDERLGALGSNNIDSKTRNLIDAYSRAAIVEEHPEWIKEALDASAMQEESVDVRLQGGSLPFMGFDDRASFISLLDSASTDLVCYTQDGVNFYRIEVVEMPKVEELLTFKEALNDGTLDAILNKTLESLYVRVKAQKAAQFMKEDGEWKSFQEAKEDLAKIYFEDLLQKLDSERVKEEKSMPDFCAWKEKDKARVAMRMLPHMKEMIQKIKLNPEQVPLLTQDVTSQERSFADQWRLVHEKEKVLRSDESHSVDQNEAFSLQPDLFSKLCYTDGSGISFFKVVDVGVLSTDDQVRSKVLEARAFFERTLGEDLAKNLMAMMQKKNAFALQAKAVEN